MSSLPLQDEDFGQRVDLTVRIREVLAAYPAGLSVLKEIVQNADDAAASTVKLCFDQRQHATERLAYPGLAQFQGPALLAYNDAEFTAADFASIQSIGNSGKRAGATAATGADAGAAPPKTGRCMDTKQPHGALRGLGSWHSALSAANSRLSLLCLRL